MSCASDAEKGTNPETAKDRKVAAKPEPIELKFFFIVRAGRYFVSTCRKVYCDPPAATSFRVAKAELAFAVSPTLNDRMSYPTRVIAVIGAVLLIFVPSAGSQDFLPSAPADRTLIYTLDERNALTPLAFETARTPLKVTQKAKSTKTSYLEIAGEHSSKTLTTNPRIFLFTTERQGSHPPFIVWLTAKRGARRATAIAQSGMTGYAIASEEIVKPTIRVLEKFGDEVFMELRPRTSLVPGEYAIIGDDLTRVATFRVAAEAIR